MRERNGCRTDLVLTKIEFDDYIVTSIRKLPLKELFFIDDWYIDRLITNWRRTYLDSEYRQYIAGLLTVPKDVKILDIDLLLWFVVRRIVDELIISLAEGFYYDEMESVIGERIHFEPFNHHKDAVVDEHKVRYFLDVLDTVYDRVDKGHDTLSWIREVVNPDYLI
ncbi:hypothetical protein [Granulicatella adiacens]|jgi:hypothetical protein|nr:MAG TPA: hypothetical protein [Caudoviricetes sp.]DAS71937.1 MAG TPA: hypothetical protein [Caudoviricetes sp.]DAX50834.1 MAG TPA: hypothetical protein [Caudoviricetes sp.]